MNHTAAVGHRSPVRSPAPLGFSAGFALSADFSPETLGAVEPEWGEGLKARGFPDGAPSDDNDQSCHARINPNKSAKKVWCQVHQPSAMQPALTIIDPAFLRVSHDPPFTSTTIPWVCPAHASEEDPSQVNGAGGLAWPMVTPTTAGGDLVVT